jgi:hypothetical protein
MPHADSLKLLPDSESTKQSLNGHDTPRRTSYTNIQALQIGEVYSILDFCCHRAPVWYLAEVDRILRLTEHQNTPDAHSVLDVWTSSHNEYVNQQKTPTKSVSSLSTSTPTTQPPLRVQPPRAAKRKAAELADSRTTTTAKKRKVTSVTASNSTSSTTSDPKARIFGDYHVSELAFRQTLHPQAKTQARHLAWFRNRLIAKTTSKIMALYSTKSRDGTTKPRRCALTGCETASPWYKPAAAIPEQQAGGAAPEADMLPSPSFANWPPPPARTGTRLLKEDIKDHVVEFAGLRFLVDICGEPPLPRVKMLKVNGRQTEQGEAGSSLCAV